MVAYLLTQKRTGLYSLRYQEGTEGCLSQKSELNQGEVSCYSDLKLLTSWFRWTLFSRRLNEKETLFRPIYVFAVTIWVDTYLLLFAASYILMYDCTSCLYVCVYVRQHVVCQKVVDCAAACQDTLEKEIFNVSEVSFLLK